MEENLDQLHQIFPAVDKSILANVLLENDMSLDRTVDAVFALETAKLEASSTASSPSIHENPAELTMPGTAAPSTHHPTGRGTKCELPIDFLRVGPNFDHTSMRQL